MRKCVIYLCDKSFILGVANNLKYTSLCMNGYILAMVPLLFFYRIIYIYISLKNHNTNPYAPWASSGAELGQIYGACMHHLYKPVTLQMRLSLVKRF